MLLCDIGNTRAKFYDGKSLWSVDFKELKRYSQRRVCFINVNDRVRIEYEEWIDIEPFVELASSYEGLGVDRKVLCSAIEDGVVVDAGSAITVDVMEGGVHQGGFIVPGFRALFDAFGSISKRLARKPRWDISLERLPLNTDEALSYGAVAPLVALLERLGEPIFLTGGDGAILSRYIEAHYDPLLLFRGMEKIVKRKSLC